MSATSLDSPGEKPAKRRKASRACLACQKAHLTCDDERPCATSRLPTAADRSGARCAKRGIECGDGLRKRAKVRVAKP